MKPDIYIGIDPDIAKSGFAIWNVDEKKLMLDTLDFWDLREEIDSEVMLYEGCRKIHVILEAGWLNQKSNFHSRKGQNKATGERIAKNVGENHAVGKLIEQYLIKSKIEYTLVKPTTKKLNAESFKRLTKWEGRTNQEERDAALLVYGR